MRCPSCDSDIESATDTCARCGHRLAPATITPGSVVAGRYEILSALGKGGMGMVFKARDRMLEEVVAIKILRQDIVETPAIAQRFRSEIKLARAVSHKNVCRIHEYGEDHGLRYISMAYVEGVDLKHVLRQRRGPLPPDQAYDVSIQVADGLQAIHEEGIIHRDLKTPNLMLDGRGVVRLMDFGIAKQWDAAAASNLTAVGQIIGTPEYMSPEQVRGLKLDARSDLYALGIVIFELFSGQTPFRAETPVATILKHLQEPPPLEGPLAPPLPAALIPVLKRALAKDRDARFSSAREMSDALRQARAALPAASLSGTQPDLPLAGLRPVGGASLTPTPFAVTPIPLTATETSLTGADWPTRLAQRAATPRVADTSLPAPRVPDTSLDAPIGATRVEARPQPAPRSSSNVIGLALVGGAAAVAVLGVLGVVGYMRAHPDNTASVGVTLPGPTPFPSALPASSPPSLPSTLAVPTPAPTALPPTMPPPTRVPVVTVPATTLLRAIPTAPPLPTPYPPPYVRPSAAPSFLPMGQPSTPPASIRQADAGTTTIPRTLPPTIPTVPIARELEGVLSEAQGAYTAGRYLDSLRFYEQALKLDPQNRTALGGKRQSEQKLSQPASSRGFAAGQTTSATPAAPAGPRGFGDGGGVGARRVDQAAPLPAKIFFEMDPASVGAGDNYRVSVLLLNVSAAPVRVRDLSITTTINGKTSGGNVAQATSDVAPGQKGLLRKIEGQWDPDVHTWLLSVEVRTAAGDILRNELSWR